jgi:hypothetical protein
LSFWLLKKFKKQTNKQTNTASFFPPYLARKRQEKEKKKPRKGKDRLPHFHAPKKGASGK